VNRDNTYSCTVCGDEVELICYCGEEPDGPSHSLVGYTHDFVSSCKCSCDLYSSNPGGMMQHMVALGQHRTNKDKVQL